MTDEEMEEAAFRAIATAHPIEVYATYPDRFWAFFQAECPGMSREEMETRLKKLEAEIAND